MFVAESVYVFFASVRGAVGVVHRPCVGWGRQVVGIHTGVFPGIFGMSVEVDVHFVRTYVF